MPKVLRWKGLSVLDKFFSARGHEAVDADERVERDARIAALANFTRARLWETDADLNVTFVVGEYFFDELCPRENTLGRNITDIFGEHTVGPAHDAAMERLRRHEALREYRYRRRALDNTYIDIEANADPLFDANGVFTGYRGVSVNVTAEVRAERDAEYERSRLREALGAIPDGFAVYDEQDRLAAFNQAYKALYGDAVKIGATFREILERSQHLQNVTHREDGDADRWIARRASTEPGELPALEECLADGRWIRNLSLPMESGGRAELRTDITEIRKREEAERESRQRFMRLFEAAANGIFVTDLEGRFLDVNPAFCSLVGMSEEELLKSDFFSLIDPVDRDDARARRWELIRGECEHFTVERLWRVGNGEKIWTRNSVALVHDADGRPSQIVAICEDISERRREQQELAFLAQTRVDLINALPAHIALLDEDGTILEVNDQWRHFGLRNGYEGQAFGIGENYLEVCEAAAQQSSEEARAALDGLRAIINGEREAFELEYPCHGPDARRWFHLMARPVGIRPQSGEALQTVVMHVDITERVNAEMRLRESRDLLEIAGQTARLGGWKIELPSRELIWSEQACEIYGVEAGFSGPVTQWSERIVESDRERVLAAVEASISDGVPYDLEFRIRHSSGNLVWIRSVGWPIRNDAGGITRIQGSVQDITKQRELQEEHRSLAERLESVLGSISDIFFSLDRDWRFTYSNRAHETLIACPRDEILGQVLWEKFPQHVGTVLEDNLRFAMQSCERVEFTHFSEVTKKWLDITAYPTVEGLAIFAIDVTERLDYERRLAHAARLTSMGEMAASLAHEINQPLSAISMAAENALMEMEQPEADSGYVAEKLDAIVEQIEHTREVVNHVRSFAHRDDSPGAVFDPVEPCRAALKMFSQELAKLDIVVGTDFPDRDLRVFGHPVRLEQAVVNILGNARDAIVTRVENDPDAPRNISVRMEAQDDRVDIVIADSGGGIPENMLEKLFEPFETSKPSHKGTGLGMSIVHSVVSSMKGAVQAENAGEGARVTICLPLHKASDSF